MSVIDHGEELYRAPPAYIDRIIWKAQKVVNSDKYLLNDSLLISGKETCW